jgi:glycosyl transferase family 2
MIAFGCAITEADIYERRAAPGIELVREPDSEILSYGSAGSIFRNYNMLIDMVAERDDLEALVLLHQDAEIVDPGFCAKVRSALADPEVALVGCAGAIGVRSIAWWEGAVTWAGFTHRYESEGAPGDIPALTWEEDQIPSFARTGEVDSIDGFVMALSPWALRNLRFDETLGQLHGYDFDLCCQARAAGKKVVTEDFRVIHHHSLDMIQGVDGWVEAHIKVAEKWDGRLPYVGDGPGDWKQRARRAEAELAATRMVGFAAEHVWSARVEALRSELRDTKASTSWRLTKPLRRLGRLVRRRDDQSPSALD